MASNVTSQAQSLASSQAHRQRRRKSARFYIRRLIQYAAMTALSIVFMVPLVWIISSSLKTQGQVFAYPPVWIPGPDHVVELC